MSFFKTYFLHFICNIFAFCAQHYNDEVVEEVKKHLKETSVENKEFTLQFKELNIKFHTLWSGLDTDQYIGVIGQIDRRI